MSFGTEPIVLNCACGHTEPQNTICPYQPGVTCGGPSHCGICRANTPIGISPQGILSPEKNQDSPTEEYPSWLGQLGPLADIVRQVEGKLGAQAANALMARLKFVASESL